jgi:hypothetical protein
MEDVDIFRQDVSGVSSIWITNFGHIGWLAIQDMDIFRQDISGF